MLSTIFSPMSSPDCSACLSRIAASAATKRVTGSGFSISRVVKGMARACIYAGESRRARKCKRSEPGIRLPNHCVGVSEGRHENFSSHLPLKATLLDPVATRFNDLRKREALHQGNILGFPILANDEGESRLALSAKLASLPRPMGCPAKRDWQNVSAWRAWHARDPRARPAIGECWESMGYTNGMGIPQIFLPGTDGFAIISIG
jgi:hypothetical protein